MTIVITDEMLIQVSSSGSAPFSLGNVMRVRALAKKFGVTEPIELHPIGIEMIRKERESARTSNRVADNHLSFGPLPPCTCDVGPDTEIVTATNGCRRGHSAGMIRFEVG